MLPEAADVAGVGPEEVDPVLCTRVLNIIALLCSLHDMPQMTRPRYATPPLFSSCCLQRCCKWSWCVHGQSS